MKETWRTDMQQKMAGYKCPAPQLSWTEIEKATLQTLPYKQPSIFKWKVPVAVAASLLALLSVAYFAMFTTESTTQQTVLVSTHTPPHTNCEPNNTATKNIANKPTAQNHLLHNKNTSNTAHTEQLLAAHVAPNAYENAETSTGNVTESFKKDGEGNATQANAEQNIRSSKRPAYGQRNGQHPNTTTKHKLAVRTEHSANSKLAINAYYSQMTGGKDAGVNGIVFSNKGTYGAETPELMLPTSVNSYMGHKMNTDIKHHQPLHMGISIRHNLSKHWSIDAGLSYSRQSTDITTRTSSSLALTQQKLVYIGIPVHANYDIWNSKRLSIYLAAGGSVEKMVKGSAQTRIFIQGESNGSSVSSVHIKPLQFSVNGAVGAEFKVLESISLYAEPGISYYFDNDSNVPNYYQDEPTNFRLNIGLRYNLK